MADLLLEDDAAAVAHAACVLVRERAAEAVAQRGRFVIALSGGSTPRALYRRLAEHPELPWSQIELCFGDERAVPPDHPDSNARMVHEALTHLPFVAPARVHRMRAELSAREAARDYERTLRTLFPDDAWPRFDLVLLGLGTDGHTASLFPHSAALAERSAWVCANWVEELASDRITLSFPAINQAREVLFLVAGGDKAEALAAVLEGDAEVADIPARGVHPAGRLTFLVDRAAARGLRTGVGARGQID